LVTERADDDPIRQRIALSIARLLTATEHGRYLELADTVYGRLEADEPFRNALAEFQRPRPRSHDDNPHRRGVALHKLGMVAAMMAEDRSDVPGEGQEAS
jgi:hypothetical protein